MTAGAVYDEIAEWYETEFLQAVRDGEDHLGLYPLLRELLGAGTGTYPIGTDRYRSVPAVLSMMVHTDMPGYAAVLREVARVLRAVLRPGGVLVHIGVHACFCGGFADRSEPDATVIGPGYLDGHWTKDPWTDQGVRDKVGASHFPLPALMHAFSTPASCSTGSARASNRAPP